jgi:hypothetical protein
MEYNIVLTSEGGSTAVIFDDDLNPTTVTEEHPNFLRIVEALRNADFDAVEEWLDPNHARVLIGLSDRIQIIDDVLHFDGDAVYDGLSSTILRYRREGRDVTNLVRFMERLAENPSRRSREQLFTWTQAKELTIDRDGYIIGFKGVTRDMLSCHSGTAFVDGNKVTGQIPNAVGTVISMPRSQVQDDPNHGCSHGLHVGNWDYASSFGQITLEVRLDPADVVSVPRDSAFQKLRCCRYEVVAVHDTDDDSLDDYEPEATWDEDEALDGFDDFMAYAPPTFMARLRERVKGWGRDN